MAEESGRHDPVHYYGPWAWIGGMLFGALIIYTMFTLADGFF